MTAPAPSPHSADLDRRLTLYPKALLLALAAAFVFVIISGDGSDTASGRVGGDFPAFYSAGTIVADGHIDDLWDPTTQAAAQEGLLGDEDGFIMFPYAPHVAGAYSVLARLPYRAAYVVHTFVMVGLLVGALHLLRPMISVIDRRFPLALAATLTSYPVFVGIGGGQNTACTLFLVALIWRSLATDRELVAGLAAAALLFRPQYALPIIGLLFLGRHWRAVGAAGVGAVGVWSVNALLFGPAWLTTWLREVRPLLEADAEVNALNEIAPIGFLHSLLGTESKTALVVGGLVSAAVVATLAWTWWRSALELDERIAVTTAGLLLIGPHTIYYDSSLLVFTVLVLFDRGRIDRRIVALAWAVGMVHLAKTAAGGSPLAVVVVAAFAATAWTLLRRSRQAEELRVLPIQDSWSPR
ncbi:MAG: glycosyltransferase 87 family protein [Acidimicrobiales bacterium]